MFSNEDNHFYKTRDDEINQVISSQKTSLEMIIDKLTNDLERTRREKEQNDEQLEQVQQKMEDIKDDYLKQKMDYFHQFEVEKNNME